jgi:hypothetical protein
MMAILRSRRIRNAVTLHDTQSFMSQRLAATNMTVEQHEPLFNRALVLNAKSLITMPQTSKKFSERPRCTSIEVISR